MQNGDVIAVLPETLSLTVDPKTKKNQPMRGTVVYIHPKKRFYTVRFDFGRHSVLECFRFEKGGYSIGAVHQTRAKR